jgi:hypothetical protein
MATNFVKGQLYSNSNSDLYGTDKGSVVTNRQSPSQDIVTWLCTAVTATFAVFKSKSGSPSGNVQRLRIYDDQLGRFVFPRGRFDGAPVFRS